MKKCEEKTLQVLQQRHRTEHFLRFHNLGVDDRGNVIAGSEAEREQTTTPASVTAVSGEAGKEGTSKQEQKNR